MLYNFCDPRLQPEIECSTVSTEGYEVKNLISDSSQGFLAYSCINPPVNIDITFLCNIRINHILIWPCVGSQKSSGFQIFAKTSNDASMPYTLLANGFLSETDAGVMFYPSNVNLEAISTPPSFLKRYMKSSVQYLTTYTSTLRICVCKTQKSVPAVGRVEVWGSVSPRCGKDIVASVHSLWIKCKHESSNAEQTAKEPNIEATEPRNRESNKINTSLDVPESFLDAITCEIMTQPMLLPSGKIIDQTTLQKHEEMQALWGRGASDPFTGILFSEIRKPIIATTLKARIDKFLLENSNSEEVKRLPRVLGKIVSTPSDNQLMEISKCQPNQNTIENKKKLNDAPPRVHHSSTSAPKVKKHCHNLPVIVCPKRASTSIAKPIKRQKSDASEQTSDQQQTTSSGLLKVKNIREITSNFTENAAVSHLVICDINKHNLATSMCNSCNCCDNPIFYQLPCRHVVCRKKLLSVKNNECISCRTAYNTSEVTRVHN